ncbi:MAG: SDR family NAD(P)-dependent oxidoreductase, partial [Rhizobacter sp.]
MTGSATETASSFADPSNLTALLAVVAAALEQEPLPAQPACIAIEATCTPLLPQLVLRMAKTLRGRHLQSHPLTVLLLGCGALPPDLPPLPAGVECRCVDEDASEPGQILRLLSERGLAPGQVLHVREIASDAQALLAWERCSPHGLVAWSRHPSTEDATHMLLAAAEAGAFPKEGAFERVTVDGTPTACVTAAHFEWRDYRIRMAEAADLPALQALEARCWPAGLRMPAKTLRGRITRFAPGQLVLQQQGQVLGVVYTQRIADVEALHGVVARTVDRLHRNDGPVLQLLALNVEPDMQHRRLGDQLLEFALQRASVMPGVEHVVGVTRCKDQHKHPDVAPVDYVRLRNEHGRLVDTVLRFHEMHGAEVRAPMPGYRPLDHVNGGYGVLVAYDLQQRRRKDVMPAADAAHVQAQGVADVESVVAQAVRECLGPRAAAYSSERPLMEMGLDSGDLLALGETLTHRFGIRLKATFFFEHNNTARVASALHEQLLALTAAQAPVVATTSPRQAGSEVSTAHERRSDTSSRDIAIIGMACRLPGGVVDPQSLWQLLIEGTDAIGALPEGRWAWPAGIDPVQAHVGIDRGGFLDDIAGFDASFFRISPREAELMDPQQRLLLELSWACLEHAGHAASRLQGTRTGVYVGASGSDYQLLLNERSVQVEAHYGLATSMAVLPNRLSYFYDFTGPSVQVDTACSSSLVALNEAVQALRGGLCEQALVGGIHLMCHPSNSIAYYKAGMLAPDAHCKTFDAAANGYVRSEGAVMLMLKPLAHAERDGDAIHAVIKGVAVNHGGQSSGITVPHPGRQAELLVAAYADAGIDARTVSYVEAHGTGTSLGDPIEIEGIQRAFAQLGRGADVPCAVGSIKSNLGHLEAAAGLAGVLKVVLGMQRRRLPANLHFRQLNPKIDLAGTGLHVVDAARDWQGAGNAPLRAGVSSFGSGGSNAHVIVEQHLAAAGVPRARGPVLVPLSSRTEAQLRAAALQLATHLQAEPADLASLAATLQLGRVPFDTRVAFVADEPAQLIAQLQAYARGDAQMPSGVYRGNARQSDDALALFSSNPEAQALVRRWVDTAQWALLAPLWVKGCVVSWEAAAAGTVRVSLPTYPFAHERYWVPDAAAGREAEHAGSTFHPLVHENRSSLLEQRFASTFSGEEFFLRDHRVQGRQVLPAAAHLEMALAAVAAALELDPRADGLTLRDVVFSRPVVAEQAFELRIVVEPLEGEQLAFELASGPLDLPVVHSQGRALRVAPGQVPAMDLDTLRGHCQRHVARDDCYATFTRMGFGYGPMHQVLTGVWLDGAEGSATRAWAELALPQALRADSGRYVLHPSLVDGALQAALIMTTPPGAARPMLPFALERVVVHGVPGTDARVTVRDSAGSSANTALRKLDIEIADMEGRVCVSLKGLSSRVAGEIVQVQVQGEAKQEGEALLFQGGWQDEDVQEDDQARREAAARHVLLCEVASDPALPFERLQSAPGPLAQRYSQHAEHLLAWLRQLLHDRPAHDVLVQLVVPAQGEAAALQGLGGLLRSAALENPRIKGQLIAVEGIDGQALRTLLDTEARTTAPQVRYVGPQRQVFKLHEATATATVPVPWKDGGRYLITGGAGGLGLIFAQAIANQARDTTLVLTGRSELGADTAARLRQIPACVDYRKVDVGDAPTLERLVAEINGTYGPLDGVIHSAGVLRDSFLIKKTAHELHDVLAPKVQGLAVLDEATRGQPLDFFVLFSSVAGVLGNVGQGDYAAANAFMDAYAAQRSGPGRSLSIGWPLWKDGGMQVDAPARARMLQTFGIQPLPSTAGVDACARALALEGTQVTVLSGPPVLIRQRVFSAPMPEPVAEPPAPTTTSAAAPTQDSLADKTLRYLTGVLSAGLKLPPERIDPHAALDAYGIDSMMVTELTNRLEQSFGALSKTLFFEYQSIAALSAHFVAEHRERLVQLLDVQGAPGPAVAPSAARVPAQVAPLARRKRQGLAPAPTGPLDIAIVGLSGRYPQARDLAAYWHNLTQGVDCISEVPAERWDHGLYFDPERGKPGKSHGKWGGFIDGVDRFDPLFFSISPRDAELMDPQERLFLQCVHETLEDAGYTRADLGRRHARHGLDGSVGVFVGVMYQEYQLYGAQAQSHGTPQAEWGIPASIANRVSHWCNFHGPSLAVDTMCSSSLTAIHLACQSILRGQCEVAIAGGVNVSVHPNKYLFLAQGQFLASDGRCRSFGEGGDGYVPGEGVGAVLLKPLAQALADGDQVYAVIKGSAINHGGKTHGYTVPNPNAQAAVISQALAESGIAPRAISYIEAHGTGTALGDPIEIAGLSKAFGTYDPQDTQYCAIGSAKSNIGHCESAAGIAGLTKVLLQMRHGQLVPSLHSEVLNPNIDFGRTPFRVQRELATWDRPVIDGREQPRTAGISSFGAGGS